MVLSTLSFLEVVSTPINFLCHTMIFFGGYYVALHCRTLPKWLSTCIWYIGLASALNLTAMALQAIYGPTFILSYTNVGSATEVILNITIAVTTCIMFINTIFKDFQGRSNRLYKK